MTWVSMHAYCHGDLDALLLHGVRPLVEELRGDGLIDGFFFLRYWDGGPHLRIRLSTVEHEFEVRDRALQRLRNYLRVHPSPDLPEPARYLEQAARWAAAEGVAEYARDLMPNNSVHEIRYEPETRRYGQGRCMATVERHFVESSRIALGLIAAGLDRDQRHTAALAAILLAWRAGPVRRPPLDAWRARPVRRPPLDDRYEARYLRLRGRLHRLAVQVSSLAAGVSPLPAGGSLSAWWQTVRTLPDRQVADLCGHLFCNRLGIGPTEEQYLRYLAARTATSGGGA